MSEKVEEERAIKEARDIAIAALLQEGEKSSEVILTNLVVLQWVAGRDEINFEYEPFEPIIKKLASHPFKEVKLAVLKLCQACSLWVPAFEVMIALIEDEDKEMAQAAIAAAKEYLAHTSLALESPEFVPILLRHANNSQNLLVVETAKEILAKALT